MIFSWFLFIKFCSKIGIRIIPFGKVEWNQLVVADLFGPYELVRPNRSLLYSSDIYRSWYCFSDRVSNAVILGEPGCLHSTCKPFDTKKLWIHLIWSLISCVASIRRPSDFFNQNSCPKIHIHLWRCLARAHENLIASISTFKIECAVKDLVPEFACDVSQFWKEI